MRTRALALAVLLGLNVAGFMAAVSCLPELAPATLAPLDAPANEIATKPPALCGDGIIDLDLGEQCDPGEAGAPGCGACKIVCEDGGFVDDAGHCYFTVAPSPRYTGAGSAEANCQNSGGHLVTFVSEAEYARVLRWAPTVDASAFWVGLSYDNNGNNAYVATTGVTEPGWAERCPGCYAHLDAGALFFPKPPNAPDSGTLRDCVFARVPSSDPWFYLGCDLGAAKLPVVCEREPPGFTQRDCFGGRCMTVRGTGRYLYVDTPRVSAAQAFESCQSLGAKPVVFETRDEREELARELLSFLPKMPVSKIWIGLAFQNGHWTWADNAPVEAYPPEWGASQPRFGQWAFMEFQPSSFDTQLVVSDDGTQELPYVCEL